MIPESPTSYIKQVFVHAVNVYSGISLVVALVIPFLPLSNQVTILGFSFFAATAFLIGGYYAWREMVHRLPKAANLSITCQNVIITGNGSRAGVPLSPMVFKINLDILNSGEDTAVIHDFKCVDIQMKNSLLSDKPVKTQLVTVPGYNVIVDLPYHLAGRQRVSNIQYQIEVELKAQERIDFASRLHELTTYRIFLSYTFDGIDRVLHNESIVIDGSFLDYKRERLGEWAGSPHLHDLFVAAARDRVVLDS